MTLFLIEYDRAHGRIVDKQSFDASERVGAESLRLEKELALNRDGVDHEVVLLEAADEHAVQQTHRRYFENVLKLADCKLPL